MARNQIRWDLGPLKKLARQLSSSKLPAPLPRRWGARYSAFVRRRFTRQGDGSWRKLSPATIKARRGKGKGAKILRDTGTLLAALTIGAPGNLFKLIRGGIRFGFSGMRHPKGKASIRDIAVFHETGAGNLPKRPILVPPDDRTLRGMQNDVKEVVQKLGKRNERLLRRRKA
ncbi:MAG: hypothetical protein IID40_07790 [Planctomycetes bacterium]|nr:hypothetical protein [Planctomycetota bacterium]